METMQYGLYTWTCAPTVTLIRIDIYIFLQEHSLTDQGTIHSQLEYYVDSIQYTVLQLHTQVTVIC